MSSYLRPIGHSTVSPTRGTVAGSWPFLQLLHGLGACALAFEETRSLCTRWSGLTTSTAFLTFVRTYGHGSNHTAQFEWGRLVQNPKTCNQVSSPSFEPLTLDFKERPSADMGVARPLPVDRSTRDQPTFGSKLPPSELVPPLPVLPASTVYSASTSCGYVATHSQPWGSPRFRPRITHTRWVWLSGTFPGGA
jgi:hypothetical protein